MVYRWMSIGEFQKYSAGIDITPISKHSKSNTTGEGIFFLPSSYLKYEIEEAEYVKTQPSPEFSLRFLSGIVSLDNILVEFDEENGTIDFSEEFGVYADPFDADWSAAIYVNELTARKYNRESLPATRYYIPGKNWNDGIWYTI